MLKYFSKSKKDESHEESIAESKLGESAKEQQNVETEKASADDYMTTAAAQEEGHASTALQADATATSSQQHHPVLSDEDELFLLHVASEGEPPPLPPRPGTAEHPSQLATQAVEEKPQESTEEPARPTSKDTMKRWQDSVTEWIKPQQDLAVQRIKDLTDSRQAASLQRQRSKNRRDAADTLKVAADTIKNRSASPSPSRAAQAEEKKEEKEVTSILDRLNLSSINNRVVGVSDDTQKLLERFNQVLKDIVNGVPTAYDDLEKLLTDRQGQLDKLYGTLPPWLQGLVKTIPVKVYAAMAPQLAAAMTAEQEKPVETKDKKDKSGKKRKKKYGIPSLKTLIGQKGMVAGMLRSIIGFLQARFPFLLAGTNIIVSLAVFILLFVFWYCHKRGRETRLAKEAAGAEDEESGVEYDSLSDSEGRTSMEKSRSLGDEDESMKEAKMITAGDDQNIEQNVDKLMEQLGKPDQKVTADRR